jgi:hypothetical protein
MLGLAGMYVALVLAPSAAARPELPEGYEPTAQSGGSSAFPVGEPGPGFDTPGGGVDWAMVAVPVLVAAVCLIAMSLVAAGRRRRALATA